MIDRLNEIRSDIISASERLDALLADQQVVATDLIDIEERTRAYFEAEYTDKLVGLECQTLQSVVRRLTGLAGFSEEQLNNVCMTSFETCLEQLTGDQLGELIDRLFKAGK